jgi:chromosome segregation ATPase
MAPTEYQQLVEFLGRQFTEIDRRFTEIDRRFTEIDRRFAEVRGDITGLRDELADLRREMLGHFDELYRRLDRLEQEYFAITQGLRRIEARLADEGTRREVLERDLAELKQHVAALQIRIDDLEQRLAR